jgi:hypothetical protein
MMDDRPANEIVITVPPKTVHLHNVACSGGCNLIDTSVRIGENPSIGVTVEYSGKRGMLYLDPRYGSFENQYAFHIPDGVVVRFFCPHCGTDLSDPDETCSLCSAPMFRLHLPRGGILEGCLRKGCVGHRLRIVDLDEQFLRLFNDGVLDSYL